MIVITTGKKSSSRLSGGCAIIITTGKIISSRLSGGCAIITVGFGLNRDSVAMVQKIHYVEIYSHLTRNEK